ncbi:hypothetical protein Agub_g9150 [Astrephomene gubernaculifera]|uniref:Uncharacterized protein n=1 Tax=Astrephomene gubernaculifera TaxID=47775 RepID=A0AAD3DSU6_9CHLO|nr:hypothetical protein Agub_g9150 [Astrephomene gubernaculifera]
MKPARLSSAYVLPVVLQVLFFATIFIAVQSVDVSNDLGEASGDEGTCTWASKPDQSEGSGSCTVLEEQPPPTESSVLSDVKAAILPEVLASCETSSGASSCSAPGPGQDTANSATGDDNLIEQPISTTSPVPGNAAAHETNSSSDAASASLAPAPPSSPAPATPATITTEELSRLQALHLQARQAVELLNQELARIERRIAALTPGGGAGFVGTGGFISGADFTSMATSGLTTTAGLAGEWFRHFTRRWALQLALPSSSSTTSDSSAPASDANFPAETATPTPTPAPSPAAAAAILPTRVTCVFPFETPAQGADGSSSGQVQYILAGDAGGMVYLLRPADGSLLAAAPSGTPSAVTACAAFPVRKTESTVVTGHANGQTRSFAVHLQPAAAAQQQQQESGEHPVQGKQQKRRGGGAGMTGGGGGGPIAPAGAYASAVVVLRHVVESMPAGAVGWPLVKEEGAAVSAAAAEEGASGEVAAAAVAAQEDAAAAEEAVKEAKAPAAVATTVGSGPAPITHILPYRLGNKPGGRRHVLVLDGSGNLRLDRDNGTVRFWAPTNDTQLAVRFAGTYAVMLSATAATVINTLQPRAPRRYTCQHLNGSRLLAASFDGHRLFRGYGLTDRGEVLSLITPHESRMHLCKAHPISPLPWHLMQALAPLQQQQPFDSTSNSTTQPPSAAAPSSPAPRGPLLSLTPLRGYLLVTHGSSLTLLNSTGNIRAAGLPALATSSGQELVNTAQVQTLLAVPPPPPATTDSGSAPPAAAPAAALAPAATTPAPPPPPPLIISVAPLSQVVVVVTQAAGEAQPSSGGAQQEKDSGSEANRSTSVGGTVEGAAVEGAAGGAVSSSSSGSVVLLLESRLPRMAGGANGSKMWSQPIFIVAMILVGLYQFWKMSKGRNHRARAGSLAGRVGLRSRRGYGVAGTDPYGDAKDYLYGGEGRVPLQPRSALRRGRSDRPAGRSVSYEDDSY